MAPGSSNLSEPQTLVSRTYLEECDWVGGRCWRRERQIFSDTKTVRVWVPERRPQDAKEVFKACLSAQTLKLRPMESPFKYNWTENGGLFTLKRK